MCLQIKQLRIDVPAGTIQPTHQLLVRDAHSAAESVLPSLACAAIYGGMPHIHISNTPSTTDIIVELDGLLQASKHDMHTRRRPILFFFLQKCRMSRFYLLGYTDQFTEICYSNSNYINQHTSALLATTFFCIKEHVVQSYDLSR